MASRHRTASPLALAVAMTLAAAVFAQDAAPPAPAPGVPQEAEVIKADGEVTARRPGEKEFTAIKVGDKLPQKTEISTGIDSKCVLKLPTAEIKIDALAHTMIDKMELKDELTDSGEKTGAQKVDTRVKLKFGTVKFNVQKGDLKTDLKISTPNSTTAIAGTEGGVSCYGDQKDQIGLSNGEARTVARSEGNFGQSATGAAQSAGKASDTGAANAAAPVAPAALAPEPGAAPGAAPEPAAADSFSDAEFMTTDFEAVSDGSVGAGDLCVGDIGGGEVVSDSGQTSTEITTQETFDAVYATEGTTTTEQAASVETSGGGTITELTLDSTSGANTSAPSTEIVTAQESTVTTLPEPPGPPPF